MDKFAGLSIATSKGLDLIAAEIKAHRKMRRWSEEDLAKRIGCARKTVRAIESGQPTVSIGFVLEAAHLVGIDLFGGSHSADERLSLVRTRLDLLPQRIHAQRPELFDDF